MVDFPSGWLKAASFRNRLKHEFVQASSRSITCNLPGCGTALASGLNCSIPTWMEKGRSRRSSREKHSPPINLKENHHVVGLLGAPCRSLGAAYRVIFPSIFCTICSRSFSIEAIVQPTQTTLALPAISTSPKWAS